MKRETRRMARSDNKSHIACVLMLILCMIGSGSMLSFAESDAAGHESSLTVDQTYQRTGMGPAGLECRYSLSGAGQDNPMPAGSSDGVYSFTLGNDADGNGEITFTTALPSGSPGEEPVLRFTHAGVYTYTLEPDAASVAELEAAGYAIDRTAYTIAVYVNQVDGGLAVEAVVAYDAAKDPEDPETQKASAIHYYHKFTGDPHPCRIDPLVKKVISGDKPSSDETFRFTIAAKPDQSELPAGMTAMPMPAAAQGSQSYTIEIAGAGEKGFGEIEYTQPGKYVYWITEKEGRADGYGYDQKVYRLVADVTSYHTDSLRVETAYTYHKILSADKAIFTNVYDQDGGHPRTGDEIRLTVLAGVMAAAVIAIILLLAYRRKKDRDE